MDDSDDEYVPENEYKPPATSSATKTSRKSTRGGESGYETSRSSSNSSIPAVPVNTKQTTQPSLSPQKRAIGEDGDMSPSKKNCKIVLTRNKKASEQTHVLPEAEATVAPAQGPQLPPAIQTDRLSLEATKKALISMCASINTSVNSLQSAQDLRDANKKIASLEAQLKAALASKDPEGQTRTLQEKVDAGLKREDELRATLEDLKLKNKATREFCDELRCEVAKLETKDQHLNLHTEKITDDQIERAWLQIAHEIQNFALQVLTRDPYRIPTPQGANQHQVDALKKNRKKVGPKLETFYYQKHIWDRIFSEIFQGGSNVWGGPGGQAFHRFCLDIGEIDFEGMEEFSRIKAHTAEYLSQCSDAENAASIKQIINGLKHDLFIFTDPKLEETVVPRLEKIVRNAVVMNYTLLKSRAFFLPSRVLDEYDEEDLDIRFTYGDPDGELEIDLQISPMISKIGDADGHGFDECSIVCRPLVVMKRV
ncbi:hypothetical protein NM208_g10714 [Fusarium decemcellulare]|uniref:Uncharacterized protein n=1 Tax=Fusarium decemcellulare TaxID=57161 RepID=A0ACC1RX35_9HYPO|nr:hypothetical protein NM208_g10714 [Fusarium decemcellulare]